MTLNFEDFWTTMQIIGLLILLVVFLFVAFTKSMAVQIWKQRAFEMEVARDAFAKKYFELREAELSRIRMEARLEEARENRMARNLRHVLHQNETVNKFPYPIEGLWPVRLPVPGSSKSKKPRSDDNE